MPGPPPAYRQFPPPAAFADVFEAVWVFSPAQAVRHHVLPDGCVDLVVRRGDATAVPHVTAAASAFEVLNVAAGTSYVGVRFRPGRRPAGLAVRPCDMPARGLFGDDCPKPLAAVAERAAAARTDADAMAVMVDALPALAATAEGPGDTAGAAIALLERSAGRVSVDAIARQLGISARSAHRAVTSAVGLSPKRIARVLRVRRATDLLCAASPPSICAVAVACGYADQAHLTREMTALTGRTPGEIAAVRPIRSRPARAAVA